MAKSSSLIFGRPLRRHPAALLLDQPTQDPEGWPAPYWFERYRGFAGSPHLIALYSGTESWIIAYHRLMPDHIEGRDASRHEPDDHLLRFQVDPISLIDVTRIHEDGTVELEDCSQIWVAPSAPWAALDCARRAWEEYEPENGGPWRGEGAKWRYCPDQELLYWTDGSGVHHRAALRASTVPIDL